MVVEHKIARYVDSVCEKLPVKYRSRASEEVSELVYDTLQDYMDGNEPDILDVREVLSQIGDADEVAAAWLSAAKHAKAETGKERGHLGILEILSLDFLSGDRVEKILTFMMNLLTIAAFLLVVIGIIGLGTHVISTMLPVFLGCILALGAAAGRGVLQRQYL